MMNDQQLIKSLRNEGYSVTYPRKLVFSALQDSEALSMSELTKRVTAINRASLYRTIDLFIKLGIAQRVNTGWKYKVELSDSFAEHHHHLSCMNCGKVIAINEVALESFLKSLATSNNFVPVQHQVEVQGYCTNCTKEV
jgi:Fur family ferric uptake transcriptional regulator